MAWSFGGVVAIQRRLLTAELHGPDDCSRDSIVTFFTWSYNANYTWGNPYMVSWLDFMSRPISLCTAVLVGEASESSSGAGHLNVGGFRNGVGTKFICNERVGKFSQLSSTERKQRLCLWTYQAAASVSVL